MHPNWDILLQNLSDIYVLVASFGAQRLLKDGEKKKYSLVYKDYNKKPVNIRKIGHINMVFK